MTFLEIAQQLVRESGTADDGSPSTVVSQTGRMSKVIGWAKSAYTLIQTAEPEWRWMQRRFSGPTISGQRNYDGNDMGVTTRFKAFVCRNSPRENRFTIYETALGVSDEGKLSFVNYDDFVTRYVRGTQTNDKPSYFTIAPDGDLWLHPIPDGIYTIQGPYRRSAQALALDADEPEMPEEFHELIVEVGLMFLGVHDETPQVTHWMLRRSERFNQLRRDQLPKLRLGERFA